MNARRSNRFLGWALALSLASHAVLLYFAQGMKLGNAADEPPPPHKLVISVLIPPTPPPATPTPPPDVAPPKPAERPQTVAVAPPALPKDDNPGPPVGPPAPVVSAGPLEPDYPPGTDAPGPTVAPPDCSDPNQEARAIDPVIPETPEVAQEEGLSGTALIKVGLDASGAVTDVSVYRSSGSEPLDAAAEQAARRTAYRPQLENCEPVAGSYIFSANFTQ